MRKARGKTRREGEGSFEGSVREKKAKEEIERKR